MRNVRREGKHVARSHGSARVTVAFDCSACHTKRVGRHWAAWTVSCATAPFRTVRCGCAERRARPQAAWDVFLLSGGIVYSRRITSAILALASAAVFVGCSDDDDDSTGPGNTDNTTVRFFNATSGGLSLDIAENGTVGT